MSLFEELKRRNIFRVGIAYAISSWLLLQLSDILVPLLNLPQSAQRFVLLILVIGFVPALILAWAFELTPEGIKKEKDVDRSQSIGTQTGRKLDRTIMVIMALALAWFAYDKFLPGTVTINESAPVETETVDGTQPESKTDAVSVEKSIAVLPFVNMSSDPEQEYFSDGISEEILNALAKVKELKVAGRTSSFMFKGKNQDLRLIGETLGVSHILEGSVRKSGNRVRITAQLIKVDDGFHLWSETYDRDLTDIFAIQDEIAAAVLQQAKIQLLDAGSIASPRANPLAFDFYLLAKQKMRDRNKASLEAAEALLDQAIAADPTFAPAYAQRGITHLLLSDTNYGVIPIAQALETAKIWLDQAMDLGPDQAESWAGLGFYWRSQRLEREKAVAPLKRALAINPNLINAYNWLASTLRYQGKLREAALIYQQMAEIDPLYRPGISNTLGMLNVMGQTVEARAVIDRARRFYPNDVLIESLEGSQLLWESKISEGLMFAETAWQRQPNDRTLRFIYTLYLFNTRQYEKAAEIGLPSQRVAALALLGRKEEAVILARKLAASGDSYGALISFLGRNEHFAELIEFIESRWPDLDAWEADFPNLNGLGNNDMILIAHAYQSMGDTRKFDDAMTRLKFSLEHQRSEGADNFLLALSEASYQQLAGNKEMALTKLEQAANAGYVGFSSRITKNWPMFKTLEGDPRYEAVQQQMLDHLNAERAKLELAPVELDRTL